MVAHRLEKYVCYYRYLNFNGADFFTGVFLPNGTDQFPTVILRSPYVSQCEQMTEKEILAQDAKGNAKWLDRGYAVVFQHCRGQGKSSGAFVPYVHEHEDGRALWQWIRAQPFYNGELFLVGASYTASLHYATAPFDQDIKGAVFEVQDSERCRLWYRNGQMRKGHAGWHFGLYKKKCGLNKTYTRESFSQLPLKGLSERVLGDFAQDFEQMLTAQDPFCDFWSTRFGGSDTKNATDHANIPILLTTGYNDFYVGGVFAMWRRMDKQTKSKSAMLVSPYNHGDGYDKDCGLPFALGRRQEYFGDTYPIDWFDHVRKGTPLPYEKGVITYYRTFENTWQSDFYAPKTEMVALSLGTGTATFCSDVNDPPSFSEEGTFQKDFSARKDVITLQTDAQEQDLFILGQMEATLKVSSNCPDTSFYVAVSIKKPQGDYVLRHDITSLCYQLGDYTENTAVTLRFRFDEHAFLLKKGEVLRVDIASTDHNTYVCHTNKKGPYYLQTEADTAINTVYLDDTRLLVPVEKHKI